MRSSQSTRDAACPDWENAPPGWVGGLARVRLGAVARGLGRGLPWRSVLGVLLVLLPSIVAAIYYGAIATDRYVSEARFVIRTASKPANALGGLNALLQLVGMSRSQDDAYAVHDFLTSRDALQQLAARLDLRAIYGHPAADAVARYPSFLFGSSDEELYRYFQHKLSVVVNNTSGLTTLRVQAFRADDAQRIALAMLELGEELVNRLNARIQQDAVRVSAAEVARAEQRRIAIQVAITDFRNRELILDPGKSSTLVVELIGKLAAELADVQAQIAETRGIAPNSPQIGALTERAIALQRQIDLERHRVADSSDGLASKIAEYERMMLEREFAIRSLAAAVQALETARTDARRQQLFLERVVEPGRPDEATMPRRWATSLTVFGFNVIGLGVVWLIVAGLREHASAAHDR
jgi:capsular polysaccharide transport system permease protein